MASPIFNNLGASANPDTSGTSVASLVTSSWSPPDGLIIAVVGGRNASGSNQPTMTGNGLTWVPIGTVTAATVHRLTLLAAIALNAVETVSTTGLFNLASFKLRIPAPA